MAAADRESPNLTLRVNPEIAKALKTRESMLMDELEQPLTNTSSSNPTPRSTGSSTTSINRLLGMCLF